ncbi:Membrane protein TerC, possibly involved in tellurium resistance [Cognatiyoonia koreensis]|uniref:Membrane protein TerC, possibly involved in tellurium resistance n=1 Tax=Cognatiyoonia koreensis TaxID=364200 RepID=A0A1I0QD59_9RHOB|nr:TerC family protein [Cognatiyoonia koreensis]SEW24986.1 Membrane protein TerC, possibly involved in tellurium resistance [Cognatiyoonia koreensis]
MAELFTLENATNLLMLCFLQAVLGFDNLLYISIESKRAPVAQQKSVRMWGIIIAVVLRVVLLFTMIQLIGALSEPFYTFQWTGVLEGAINFATCVFIVGGVFIMYTAVKEIGHMLSIDKLDHDVSGKSAKSATQVVILIVMMNLIFSFDSVLSALAITDVFPVLAIAIILSGLAMLLLADSVAAFLEANRMYEVLGLFILLIVGVVLLGEAGQAAVHGVENMGVPHEEAKDLALKVFGKEIVPMSKSTFYFSVIVLVAVEIIQSGYSRKLNAERKALQKHS